MLVCFFDVLYVDAPWVSALQILVGPLDLRQEELDARKNYRCNARQVFSQRVRRTFGWWLYSKCSAVPKVEWSLWRFACRLGGTASIQPFQYILCRRQL